MTRNYVNALIIISLILAYSCKVPYQPTIVSSGNSYLVVEGVVNNGNNSTDSTTITLSRTNKLTASDAVVAELHAQVSVEDGNGFSVALKEKGKGNYVSGPLGIDNTKQYRLRIITADKKIYLSDLAASIYTPPIDSIGYTILNNTQITIYANAHNPANNTRYYRWDFNETWKFKPAYSSDYVTNGSAIVHRDVNVPYPWARFCYSNAVSTDVIIGSTEKLAGDVVYQQPITYITGSSIKLEVRYSMLLKQYGLTKDAYTFWSQLKKNTEQLGSIFDAQPSQINGNIHCITNLTEAVFGYVSITNIQTKRFYVNRSDLPASFLPTFISCGQDSSYTFDPHGDFSKDVDHLLVPFGSSLIPVSPFSALVAQKQSVPPGYIIVLDPGYMATGLDCLDCTLTGSKNPPPFWMDQ